MMRSGQSMNGSHKSRRGDEGAKQIITVRHILVALRKWWLLAVPIGGLAAATTAALMIAMFEPQYTASAWLRIESNRPFVAFQDRGNGRSFIANQIELIGSPLVMGPVIADKEIARIPEIREEKDPISWLASKISVKSVGGSDLFTISYTGPDGHDAAKIVNKVYESYTEQRSDEEIKRTQRVLELLNEEQERRAIELARLEENVREMAKEYIINDPSHGQVSEAGVIQHPLAGLQRKRSEREVEEAVLKAKIEALKESFKKTPVEELPISPAELAKAIDADPSLQMMEQNLEIQRSRLSDYEKLVNYAENPLYQQTARSIQAEEQRIAKYRQSLRPSVEASLREDMARRQQEQVAELENQLANIELAKQMLDSQYEMEVEKLKQTTGQSLDLEFMKEDLAWEKSVSELITERIVKIETEQRAPDRVVLLQAAEPALTPVQSLPVKPILLGVIVSFFAPFVLAVGWERFAERVSHSEQIEEQAQLPIIGEIASLPRRVKSSRPAIGNAVNHSVLVYQESFDNLRTLLVLAEELRDAQVLAITSASNNEGKTSVAVQLAASLARATQERVLLVDGDMRSPDVHRVLQVDSAPGLAEFLAGECTFEDAVSSGWGDNVEVIPAGRLRGVPHRLVGSAALEELLEAGRRKYRYVVIDTPPILAASESLVFAKAADASILVTMRDVSRMAQVQQAYQRLESSGANAIGAVLNGVPTRRYAYRYGHYGYSTSSSETSLG